MATGLIVGIMMLSFPAHAETVRMATIDFCPFTCAPDKEGGKEGFMTDIVRYALEKAGYDLEVAMMPYVRAVSKTRDGTYDGIMVVGKFFAPDLVYPELPVVSQRVAFIVKKGVGWTYESVRSLESKRIGIVKGYHYVDKDLQAYLLNEDNSERVNALHGLKTTERNIEKLLEGRIDVYLEGEFSLLYVLKKLGVDEKVDFAGFTNEAFDDYVGFSPKSQKAQELTSLMTETIRELERTGKLKEFLMPYIGEFGLNQLDH